MASDSKATTDHQTIMKWTAERGGIPSAVRDTGDGDPGVLRIDFPGYGVGEEQLKHISWEEFFEKFEDKDLAFLYQETTKSGDISRFFKFVDRRNA
mgnify:CR=1 FL=1